MKLYTTLRNLIFYPNGVEMNHNTVLVRSKQLSIILGQSNVQYTALIASLGFEIL